MHPRVLLTAVSAVGLFAASVTGASASPAAGFTTYSSTRQLALAYSPNQIASAYNVTPLLQQGITGSGQTIALVELDRFQPGDLAQFDDRNNLPAPTIKQYFANNKSFRVPVGGESTMDIEWAHALAPQATIQMYYMKNSQASVAGWKAVASTVNMAVANGAGMISLSFGTCGPTSGYTNAKNAFAKALKRGVSVFVSSGDYGARPGPVRDCGSRLGVSYPASDPSVVSVGGTSLTLNLVGNSVVQEVAWSGSGGGSAKPLLRPSWQVTPNLSPGKYRFAPDVSFLGDPNTCVSIFYRGSEECAAGTSLGAPAWAGIWSLVREDAQNNGKTLGAAPALVYRIGNSSAYAQAFHDITSGSNGHYSAKVGWDAVTGWGTPNVAGLAGIIQTIS